MAKNYLDFKRCFLMLIFDDEGIKLLAKPIVSSIFVHHHKYKLI